MTAPRLTFLGAAGTVTGSKYAVRAEGREYLVECGLFQGADELEQRDWRPLGVSPKRLSAVLLTHAHLDHSGYLPRLVADGFSGPVYATSATIDLLHILLPDAGRLQEEQAAYANKTGYARHRPARPLYTERDAERALRLLRPLRFGEPNAIDKTLTVTPRAAGHLLGSATFACTLASAHGDTRLVFSGDVGRYGQEVMNDPEPVRAADALVLEATYGDRSHPTTSPRDALRDALRHILSTRGALVIPSFAVGRAQHVLYHLRELQDEGGLDEVPIYLDSPMAIDATDTYCAHAADPNLRIRLSKSDASCPLHAKNLTLVRSSEASRRLNGARGPLVIISANGMCTGGRILHHLKRRLPDPANAVVFVGYQARGTRGRLILERPREIRIHGEVVPLRARIFDLEGMSGHADQTELLRWAGGFEAPPHRTFLVHGEAEGLRALEAAIVSRLHWAVKIPRLDEAVDLAKATATVASRVAARGGA
ncbi:MAG: MBL fold metallo-hydrolase RNA specificity domain-containing protein [Thermoplasmatota archaeon]